MDETQQCPFCAETIKTAAKVCRYCRLSLATGQPIKTSEAALPKQTKQPAAVRRRSNVEKAFLWALATILVAPCVYLVGNQDKKPRSQTTAFPTTTTPQPTIRNSRGKLWARTNANVRSGPSTSAPVVGKLTAGESVEYEIELEGKWFKLAGGDASRWVHTSVVMTESDKKRRENSQLEIDGWSWHQSYDYAIAEGRVRNVSGKALENVLAVVTFETGSGQFITSDSALVEYDPLLPGQTAPWKVMARWNPAMKTASVEFKTMFGGKLSAYSAD